MHDKKKLFLIPLFIVGFALFVALGGEVVKLLWNELTPALFGWREVTFWQALGLLVLCRLLFGGLGGGGGSRHGRWRRRRHLIERWERMSPEEREWLAARLREREGCVPPGAPGAAPREPAP